MRPASGRRRVQRGRRRRLNVILAAILTGLATVLILGVPSRNPESPATGPAVVLATSAASSAFPMPSEAARDDEARDLQVTRAAADAAARFPAAPAVAQAGTGRLRLLPIPGRDSRATGRQLRYTVAIENGLRVRIVDFPETVRAILTARLGWESVDPVHFVALSPTQATAGARPDIQVILASPALVDRLCYPLQTHGEVSCQVGGKVVLNARRWWAGASTYGDDLASYRTYLVNHEIGHALGRGHAPCSGEGGIAPVMLQQTIGLDGCERYPYPR